jgi:nitrogenase subunit NifH
VEPEASASDDILRTGYGGVLTIEASGPEPGIGCADRGIISMFEILEKLEVITDDIDVILYDVLGDVVCGVFAVPIRKIMPERSILSLPANTCPSMRQTISANALLGFHPEVKENWPAS